LIKAPVGWTATHRSRLPPAPPATSTTPPATGSSPTTPTAQPSTYPARKSAATRSGAAAATRYYSPNAVRTTTAGLTWQCADAHGTAQLSIKATDLSITRRKTDPYGNPRGTQPTWPTTRGFLNGHTDPTGLTHLGAREYDPTTGRFISIDPILNPADPLQMNGYTYADNNPTTNSDPTGLEHDAEAGACSVASVGCGAKSTNEDQVARQMIGHTPRHAPDPNDDQTGRHTPKMRQDDDQVGRHTPLPTSTTKILGDGTFVATVNDFAWINGSPIPPGAVYDVDQFALAVDAIVHGKRPTPVIIGDDIGDYEDNGSTESRMLFACLGSHLCDQGFIKYLELVCSCYHPADRLEVPAVPGLGSADDEGSLTRLSRSRVQRLTKQLDTDPHDFKSWYVGRDVSQFDVARSSNGRIWLVNKRGDIKIETDFTVDQYGNVHSVPTDR
jgi:RHS repeat-associated protein